MRYELLVEYLPGKEMYIADALSRASINVQDFSESDIIFVHSLTEYMPVSDSKMIELKNATDADKILNDLKVFLRRG